MSYQIELTQKASKQLKRLGAQAKHKISQTLKRMLDYYDDQDVPEPDIKMLKGKYHGLLRLRIGNMRVIFKMEHERLTILIVDVVSRGSAYKK